MPLRQLCLDVREELIQAVRLGGRRSGVGTDVPLRCTSNGFSSSRRGMTCCTVVRMLSVPCCIRVTASAMRREFFLPRFQNANEVFEDMPRVDLPGQVLSALFGEHAKLPRSIALGFAAENAEIAILHTAIDSCASRRG